MVTFNLNGVFVNLYKNSEAVNLEWSWFFSWEAANVQVERSISWRVWFHHWLPHGRLAVL